MNWFKNIFKKKDELVEYPKNSSWMLNEDLTPNKKALRKCKAFHDLIGLKQNRKYHMEGDVWTHTLNTANEMHKIISAVSWFLTANDKKMLMIAALCHDLGKAPTTYFDEKEGEWRCKNHGLYSERITRELLFDENLEAREEICWLVRWHMSFHYFDEKSEVEQLNEIIKLSKGFSTIEKLLLLHTADYYASKSKENTKQTLDKRLTLISNIAMSCKCYNKPYSKPDCKYDCTMYVMIGLPGSGKDTYINKFLKNLPCICRDDIREEVYDGQVLGRKLSLDKIGEQAVTNIVNERIHNCCINKKDFVINQTSLKKKYRDSFKDNIPNHITPKIVYIYIEAPSIQECINRRGGDKWDKIINKMWEFFDFPDKSECDDLIIIKQ